MTSSNRNLCEKSDSSPWSNCLETTYNDPHQITHNSDSSRSDATLSNLAISPSPRNQDNSSLFPTDSQSAKSESNPLKASGAPVEINSPTSTPISHLSFLNDYYSADCNSAPISPVLVRSPINKHVGLYAPNLSPTAEPTYDVPSITLSPVSPCSTTVASDYENDADTDEGLNDYKSEIDAARQRGAEVKALRLLDISVTGKVQPTTLNTQNTGLTAKQAANLSYEKKLKEKLTMKQKQKDEQGKYRDELLPKLLVVQKPKLAETTRKPKPHPDKSEGFQETIADMKCKMDIERENEAKKKALKLLSISDLD